MKRLLFVSNEGSLTGAPLFISRLIKFIKVRKPEFEIAILFAQDGPVVHALRREGIRVFVSQKRGSIKSNGSLVLTRILYYLFYVRVVINYRPDLIYSNTLVNFGEVILAGFYRIPVILHMHEGRQFASAFRYRLKISCYFSTLIIVGSKYVRGVLRELTGRDGVVIYNGIEIKNQMISGKAGFDSPIRIGVLGSIDSNKGQIVAIRAIKFLVDKGVPAKLMIAGKVSDKQYFCELLDFVDKNNLSDYVEFSGVVESSVLFLQSLDFLVVPSFDEAFPTVILEAFSVGVVVMASNVGGIPEMIKNGESGFLFEAGDSEMLSDLIEKFFQKKLIVDSIRKDAFRILTDRFCLETACLEISEAIDKCVCD